MSALHQKMCDWDHNPNLWILIPVTHLDSDSSVNPLDSDPSNTFGLWHPCPLVCVGTNSLDSVSFPIPPSNSMHMVRIPFMKAPFAERTATFTASHVEEEGKFPFACTLPSSPINRFPLSLWQVSPPPSRDWPHAITSENGLRRSRRRTEGGIVRS